MKKTWKKIVALFLAVVLGASSIDINVMAAFENNEDAIAVDSTMIAERTVVGECEIVFQLVNQWEDGYQVEVTLENRSTEIIHNWYIEMLWDGILSEIWNAKLERNLDEGYYIKNDGWNQDIEVGGTVSFGIKGEGEFPGFPKKYILDSGNRQISNEDFGFDYQICDAWDSGFTAEIALSNLNEEIMIEDWILEFDYDGFIYNMWNAKILSHEGNHYKIQNAGYNGNIVFGQTLYIGFNAQTNDSKPSGVVLCDAKPKHDEENQLFQEPVLCIDTPDLEFDSTTGVYLTKSEYISFKGTLINTDNVKSFVCKSLGDDDYEYMYADVPIASDWILNDLELHVGINKIVFQINNETKSIVTIIRQSPNHTFVQIDKSGFEIDKLTGEVITSAAKICLHGTVDAPDEIDNLFLICINEEGVEEYRQEIAITSEWIVEDIDLKEGANIFEVLANSKDENVAKDRIVVVREKQEASETVFDRNDDDEDGLPNYYEEWVGTRLDLSDTDEDGLSDYEEVFLIGTNPTEPDTDGDGIEDGEDDEDGDGLCNRQEILAHSDPQEKDTDGDGLWDGEEVFVYHTNPLVCDTDGDGVSDGLEVELGSNPIFFEEIFSVVAYADEEDVVKVSVEADLSGVQANSLSVKKADWANYIPEGANEYIGDVYDFSVNGTLNEAIIKFEFPQELLDKTELNFYICHLNEETQELETIETFLEGNVAFAKVSHFSLYRLIAPKSDISANKWLESQNWQPWVDIEPYMVKSNSEVVLVIEDSNSMQRNDPSRKRLEVARNFIDRMPDGCRMGIIRCADTAESCTEVLTSDKEVLKEFLSVDNFPATGKGGYNKGAQLAFSMLDLENEKIEKRVVYFIDDSDMDWDTPGIGTMTYPIYGVKSDVISLVSIMSGDIVKLSNLIIKMSADSHSSYAEISNSSKVHQIIENAYISAVKVDDTTDSDEDGLPDLYEDCIKYYQGVEIYLDKHNPDCDEDCLLDGEEVKDCRYELSDDGTKIRVKPHFVCNPNALDTDLDGLDDYDELNIWETKPNNQDTDSDGLTDGFEAVIGFDPTEANADGDSRTDSQEWEAGSNPRVYDKTKIDYIVNFGKGFFSGDFIQDADDFPMLAGQIISSCIPFVDVRDVAGNMWHGNYAMAGMSAIGLLPYAGDIAKAGSKIGRFLLKNVDNVPETTKLFKLILTQFPDLTKNLSKSDDFIAAMEKLAKSDLNKLTKSEFDVLKEFAEKTGLKGLFDSGSNVIKFDNWDNMKKAYKSVVTRFIREKKPKYSPVLKRWFENGGAIEIKEVDGKSIWTYTSALGDSVPYINGYIDFPEEYLYPMVKSINISEFSGNREKDMQKFLEKLKNDYKIDEIPVGYVVHHDIINGVVQLVQENIHKLFTHIGGHSLYK